MSISRVSPHFFPARLCSLALGIYYVASFLLSYANLNLDKLRRINGICDALIWTAIFILGSMLLHWIWQNFLSRYFSKQTTSSALQHYNESLTENNTNVGKSLKDDIAAKNNIFVSVLAAIGVICTIILLTDSADFIDFTPTNLALIHIAFSVFALGLLICHLRKFRSDALLRLHVLVNKKTTLLKYVHELFEPISTIYKAQKQMMDELGEVSAIIDHLLPLYILFSQIWTHSLTSNNVFFVVAVVECG